jgi:predicted O-methyltransferase YrrM
MDTNRRYYFDDHIDFLLSKLKSSEQEIITTDLGAGSKVHKEKLKTVSQISKSAVSSIWQLKCLFNLSQFYKPKLVLELGTSLGISALHFANGYQKSRVISIEGDPAIATLAQANFNEFQASNIRLVVGNFDDKLVQVLSELDEVDMVFLDGNHRKLATLEYLDLIVPKLSSEAIVIVDDIYWSSDMKSAWDTILAKYDFDLGIDLFHFGILFKNKNILHRQNVKLINSRLKPIHKSIFFP